MINVPHHWPLSLKSLRRKSLCWSGTYLMLKDQGSFYLYVRIRSPDLKRDKNLIILYFNGWLPHYWANSRDVIIISFLMKFRFTFPLVLFCFVCFSNFIWGWNIFCKSCYQTWSISKLFGCRRPHIDAQTLKPHPHLIKTVATPPLSRSTNRFVLDSRSHGLNVRL